jgi:hypothetical protein
MAVAAAHAKEKPATRAISDSPAVRSAYQEREAVPVAGRRKKNAVDCTAAQAVAAALRAKYRHGDWTKAAIAEQRKFSALLKMLRAGLT